MTDMTDATPKSRWYCPTPKWLVTLLLVTIGFLFLSERFQWFGFNHHKGWTVLIAVASAGVFLLLMLLWFVAALLFRVRFQFSLGLLLVLVVVVALPFSWLAVEIKKTREQQDAVAALLGAGFTVWYQEDQQEFMPFWLSPTRIPATPSESPWLLELLGKDFFHSVEQADCNHDIKGHLSTFTDSDFARIVPYLSKLPAMKALSVSSSQMTDNGLSPLENLTNIKNLTFGPGGFSLGDEGLKHIAKIRQLETLNVRTSTVSDDGLSYLRGLPDLRCIFLYSRNVTRRSLPIFASLPKLEELYLYDSDLTDADVKDLMREKPSLKVGNYRSSSRTTSKTHSPSVVLPKE